MSWEVHREGGAEPSSRYPRARLHAVAQKTDTPTPVSTGVPGTGFYLMELSDETSRSESSVSLGGGGGSLSGTAVKAGDFLEKNTRCHLEPSKKQNKKNQKTPAVTLGQVGRLQTSEVQGDAGQGLGRKESKSLPFST